MNKFEVYDKCIAVIGSVNSHHHLIYAAKYLRVAIKYADKNNLNLLSGMIKEIRYGSRFAWAIGRDAGLVFILKDKS